MLKRSELKKWFPDDELLVVPVTALPEGISEPATRALLTEVGVPESFLDVVELDTGMTEQVRLLADVYRKHDEDPPEGVGRLYYLGFAGQSFLAVDGHTGTVFQVHREFGARPMASSLESFFRVLGFVSGEARKHQRKGRTGTEEFLTKLSADTIKQLRRTDPQVSPDAEVAWRKFFVDIGAPAS